MFRLFRVFRLSTRGKTGVACANGPKPRLPNMNKYRDYLRQQLLFIRNSCDAYDRGEMAEAIRIGTAIRVILHQTSQSTSLLTHLGATDVRLLTTTRGPSQPGVNGFTGEVRNFDGMAALERLPLRPKLGNTTFTAELPAPDWWSQAVMVIERQYISRRVIVLAAANKDGGAHVDVELPPEYAMLVEGVWTNVGTGESIPDHHVLCLRQFGYELLNSPSLLTLATADVRRAGATESLS